MWENTRLMKKMSGRPVSAELSYDIDMLEMIRWPSIEDTPDLFETMTSSSCQGRGPYDSLFPFQHIVPCSGSLRNFISDDALKSDFYFNRMDCDDDTLMVTSNDALRFEEDCLFESPSPSYRNVPPQSSIVSGGAESGANHRFLCQRNSMADMTLAQLNDSNASDTKSHRVDLACELKVEVHDLDQNFDPMNENFSSASKPLSSSSLLSTKDNVASRLLPSKQNNVSQQSLFAVKDEYEGSSNVFIKREIKTENLSPVKCSLKTTKTLKRSRTSSFALSEGDGKDETKFAMDRLKSLTPHQGHNTVSSISSSNCWPVGKKIKLEITESATGDNDDDNKFIMTNSDVTSLPPQSKSVVSDEDEEKEGGRGEDSDDLSDTESVLSKSSSAADVMRSNGGSEKRYFWQYNIQAKGPKEKRLCKNIGSTDPHIIKDFEDPVFDPGHSNVHFVHSGKARKGDGTDITPNPHKLLQIGCELKTLNCTIEDMMQASDFITRTTTMKEKNKYASRVCRLKKKAQHEANKIKLQGLNEEHNQLMLVLNSIKSKLRQQRDKTSSSSSSASSSSSSSSSASSSSSSLTNNKRQQNVNFTEELDNLTKSCLRVNVAGRADDYVSSILLDSSANTDKDDVWLYSD